MATRPRVTLITGAGGGIARATALALAAEGSPLALCDLRAEPLDETVRLVKAAGGKTFARTLDVRDPQQVKAFVAAAADALGSVDVLVNCAGIFKVAPTQEMSLDAWNETIAINLTGTFLFCQAAIEPMRTAGGGVIVNIASTAAQTGSMFPTVHYAASKGGVIGLTKALARELAPLRIRVNAVAPGPVDTPLLRGPGEETLEAQRQRTLVGRLGTPEDIAAAIKYLVGDGATWVTGAVLPINGGALL